MTRVPSGWLCLYELLLHAFPRSYRADNAAELIAFFCEGYAEHARAGRRAVGGYLLRAYWDVIREGIAERLSPGDSDTEAARLAPEISTRGSVMNGLGKDIAHALRTMRRAPGWASLIVVTMGLGISASTVIFTMFDAVLLRPLPFAEPQQLVSIVTTNLSDDEATSSNLADFGDWRRSARSFSGMAAYTSDILTISVGELSERLQVTSVSPQYFQVLGVAPAVGRSFAANEDEFGSHRVVVLRHDFWATRFGADSSAIGKTLQIGATPFTIVGVMPEGWPGAWSDVSLWRPMSYPSDYWRVVDRRSRWMEGAVGRLQTGVTLASANAELRTIGERLAREYPESNQNHRVRGEALRAAYTAESRTPLRVLFGAVILLLVIGCTNIANMLLARAAAREREVGVRRALGASRMRLARLTLVESLVLGLCGGALGILWARWLLPSLVLLAGDRFPGLGTPRLDARVLGFAVLTTLITAIGFGLAPVLHGWRNDVQSAMRGERVAGNRRTQRALGVITTAQSALAVILLTGAALLTRSLQREGRVDLGFDAEGVLAFQVALLGANYPTDTARLDYLEQLRERLAAIPGVRGVASTYFETPLSGGAWWTTFGVQGRPVPDNPADQYGVRFGMVTGDYFTTLKIRVVRGRALTPEDDRPGAQRVAVISERLAQRHFPNEDPIGKGLWLFGPQDMTATIVGVVDDVRAQGARVDAEETVYVPTSQTTHGVPGSEWILLRTDGNPALLTEAVRAAVRALDRTVATDRMGPLTQIARDALAPARFNMILVSLFAGLAVVLAAIGLYGVMSYSTAQQRRDIGVRLALGARPYDAVRQVLLRALVMVGLGLTIGISAAVWLGHALSTLLFGVEPFDLVTLVIVAATLLLVALTASAIPARNAARVAPAEAMRQ